MSTDPIRSLIQIASGITDMTVTRATETARDLAALAGLDGQMTSKKLHKQVSEIAQDLLDAAAENRDQLVALIRAEVERAVSRADVARVPDLDATKAAVAALVLQVEDLGAKVRGHVPGAGSGPEPSRPASSGASAPSVEPTRAPESAAGGRRRPPRRSFAGSGVAAGEAGSTVSVATTTAPSAGGGVSAEPAGAVPAKKAPVAKTAKKSSAKKSPAKAAAKKSPAKSPAKKSPAKAAAKKSPAKAAAKKSPAKAATKKAPAAKTARRSPATATATEPSASARKSTARRTTKASE